MGDAKVADDHMAALGETLFVSGPPRSGVPAFQWETATSGMPAGSLVPPHYGHPQGPWKFPWLLVGEGIGTALAGEHAVTPARSSGVAQLTEQPTDLLTVLPQTSKREQLIVYYA